jgi:hypothetical protein
LGLTFLRFATRQAAQGALFIIIVLFDESALLALDVLEVAMPDLP